MINGLLTSEEARIRAQINQGIITTPALNKVEGYLKHLQQVQEANPTATSINPAPGFIMPLVAVTQIQQTWGYEFTYQNTATPPQGTGQWVEILSVSWSGQRIDEIRSMTLVADVASDPGLNVLKDTGLSFAVRNGHSYYFKAFIPYTAAVITTGCRFVLAGPTAVLSYRSSYPLTATTQTTNFLSGYNLPAAANANTILVGNAELEGVVSPSADGTVAIRFASEVAASAITVRRGSYLEWKRTL